MLHTSLLYINVLFQIACRFHQHLIVHQAIAAIEKAEEGVEKKCLLMLAAVCRSGKTYMAAGIVRYLSERRRTQESTQGSITGSSTAAELLKVCVLTTRPTETSTQWKDVFKDHKEFHAKLMTMPEVHSTQSLLKRGGSVY